MCVCDWVKREGGGTDSGRKRETTDMRERSGACGITSCLVDLTSLCTSHPVHSLQFSRVGPTRKNGFAHEQREDSNVTVVIDLDYQQYMADKVGRQQWGGRGCAGSSESNDWSLSLFHLFLF